MEAFVNSINNARCVLSEKWKEDIISLILRKYIYINKIYIIYIIKKSVYVHVYVCVYVYKIIIIIIIYTYVCIYLSW